VVVRALLAIQQSRNTQLLLRHTECLQTHTHTHTHARTHARQWGCSVELKGQHKNTHIQTFATPKIFSHCTSLNHTPHTQAPPKAHTRSLKSCLGACLTEAN